MVDAFFALYGDTVPAAADPAELVLRAGQLRTGMVLARDIVAPGGTLLLVREYALNRELIDGLIGFERANGVAISASVYPPAAELEKEQEAA